MSEQNSMPELDDMPEITDFSKGHKNPFAEKIKKEGYTIMVHYSPEEVANGSFDDTKDIIQALVDLMSANDSKRLLVYIKNNFNLPCSPDLWDGIEESDETHTRA